jgi:hypothetical protein
MLIEAAVQQWVLVGPASCRVSRVDMVEIRFALPRHVQRPRSSPAVRVVILWLRNT